MLALFSVATRRGESSCGVRRPRCAPAWFVAALLGVGHLPGAVTAAEATTKASHFVLANGMEVVVVPNHRVPIVTHQVWYKSGGAEDPDDQPGIAHFLEHLMFKGTKAYPGNSFERFAVANGGAGTNAYTYQDLTVYPQSLPKKHLAALMEREADRMVNLVFSDEQVKAEVGVVQNERRGNDNSPSYLLGEKVRAALFPGHPSGRSIIGTEAEIATLDRVKALAYYKRYYAPNNAVLVVAGDVKAEEVRKLAEATFGRIPPNKNLPKRIVQPLPKKAATLRIDMEHERVASASVGFYYVTPGSGVLGKVDGIGLNLLGRVAGTSIIGRLYHTLVTEKKLAINFTASHWYDLRGGILSFAADAAPGVPIADLEAAVGREIATLVRDGVTAAEVDDARKALVAAKAYVDDNHRVLAEAYGSYLARGMTVADVEAGYDRAGRLTTDDINKLIARYMAKTDPVVAVLRPVAPKVAAPAPR